MLKSIAAAVVLNLFLTGALSASAWTSEKGHGQAILTTSWFETNRGYDMSGKLQRFGFNGRFRKFDVNPYVEFGVSNRTTVLVNAFVPSLRYSNDYGEARSAGLGDVETGVRHRLTSRSARTVVSVQGLIAFPTYSVDRTPPPGNHQIDYEPRVLVGRGYQLETANLFWGAETAMRFRTGAPADQWRMDGTVGAGVHRRLMLMGQVFGIMGLRNGAKFGPGTNPNVQSDFDMFKVQTSAVFRVSSNLRLQTAYFQTIAGRNTGFSRGVVLSFWHNF